MISLAFLGGVVALFMLTIHGLGWASFMVSSIYYFKTSELQWKKSGIAGLLGQILSLSMFTHLNLSKPMELWQIRLGIYWALVTAILFVAPFLLRRRSELKQFIICHYIKTLWITDLALSIILIFINVYKVIF